MLKAVTLSGIGLGSILIVLSVSLGWFVAPELIDYKVELEMQLINGSDTYTKWEDIPVPIYLKFYLWNITNYEDFLRIDSWNFRPIMQEVGPYVYRETRVKYDITPDPGDYSGTIFYRQNISYVFDPELSIGNDTDDLINIFNVPLFSVAAVLSTKDEIPLATRRTLLQTLLGPVVQERLVKVGVPAREVIWGWRLHGIYTIIEMIGAGMGISFPPEMNNGMFGFYNGRNNTNSDGLYEIHSGVEDSSLFAKIRSIDGNSSLDGWWTPNSPCAMINGTDGTMFPPRVEKGSTLYVHVPEICRGVWLRYTEDTSYEGIPGYRFRIPPELFTSPDLYPANRCFCPSVKQPLNRNCNFNGAGRISSCKGDAPIIISKPHFLDAQESIKAQVGGIDPNSELHDTFIDVEPMTGFPLRAKKRLQIGVELQPLPEEYGPPWNTSRLLLFPTIWVEEEASLTPDLVRELKEKLLNPLYAVKVGKWVGVGIGITLTSLSSMYFVYLTWIKTEN